MNVALRTPMTLAQFLMWEERQEQRWEFDGFRPVAMTGGTIAHSAIQANLLSCLVARLRGSACRPHGSHLKIEVAGSIRYPDAFVVCTPVPPRATVVHDPAVVFEVLSESTAGNDLVVKNAEYRATPSILHYVVLQQTSAAAMLFSRKGDDWVSDLLAGEAAVLRLPGIGIEIPLAEIYEGLDLGAADEVGDDATGSTR
jgi:Uma2 family endonuclease